MFESQPIIKAKVSHEFESFWFSHRLIIGHDFQVLLVANIIPHNQIKRQKTAKIGQFFATQIEFETQGTLIARQYAQAFGLIDGHRLISLEHMLKPAISHG